MLVLAMQFSRSSTNGAEGASFVGTEGAPAGGRRCPWWCPAQQRAHPENGRDDERRRLTCTGGSPEGRTCDRAARATTPPVHQLGAVCRWRHPIAP
jgi:hypothetical protein